ncbi:hypothetical protein FSP39_007554 [Pinctada imbricata]|uniref:Uncharacterized protein n=1 Tax=Pinctada imbricata TaxID=66713 RepID=A0AA88Y713_PINIB|nr:hypothetical protein FSP39_007554 [Pinctada imbricata]
MKISNLCFILALVVALILFVDGSDPKIARKGLEAGKRITDAIEQRNFVYLIPVFQFVPLYLYGIVSVFGLIFGLGSGSHGESMEMKYLRDMSKLINTRFDDVDAQLSDMEKLVQMSAIQAPYLTIALKIRAVSRVYQTILTVPISDIKLQRSVFITNYESDYQNSGYKLFLGFVKDLGPFGGRLLDSAMKFYEYDRTKIRQFMMAATKLLFMASQLELAYYSAKGASATLMDFHRSQWEDRFQQVSQRMSTVDKMVAFKERIQFSLDVERFALDYRGFGNSFLSNNLYKKLSTKYYWRDWLVIVSDHINKHDKSQVCGGYAKSIYGKDIIVTSVSINKTTIGKRNAEGMANSLTQTCKTTSYHRCYKCNSRPNPNCTQPAVITDRCCDPENSEDAETIYSWINPYVRDRCTAYGSVGIIYKYKNVAYSARRRNNTSTMNCDLGWCTDKRDSTQRYPEFERLFVHDIGSCKYRAHFFG